MCPSPILSDDSKSNKILRKVVGQCVGWGGHVKEGPAAGLRAGETALTELEAEDWEDGVEVKSDLGS